MRIPVPFAIVVGLLTILVDVYIYFDIKRFSSNRISSKIYAATSLLCWIFLGVVLCLPRRDADSSILFIMWALYAFISIYIPKIIYLICSLCGYIPLLLGHRRVNSGLWVGAPLALLTFAAVWWGALVGRKDINVEEVAISSTRIPESFDGYRILQFSDAHVGTWGKDTVFISKLVETINAQNPDLIVFTGDIVNRETSELAPFRNILSRLKAKDGVVSILGNHDYGDYITWADPQLREENNRQLVRWQEEMGWKMLNNETLPIVANGDSIMIVGVENWGEPPFHQYGKLKEAYPGKGMKSGSLNDSHYKILLTHNPEHWRLEATKISNFDLTLSGHTHAMQFMIELGGLKWSPAQYRYDKWAGSYFSEAKDGTPMQLYVNIGCGEVGLPFRLGATPELTVFTLESTAAKNAI